jgi:DNA-binding NtrC family response regulator
VELPVRRVVVWQSAQPEAVRLFSRDHILDVRARTRFNKRDAARLLGISLASLYRKLNIELADADEEE